MSSKPPHNAETQRLAESTAYKVNWQRWGPYLAERQWGTVREDYSADGNCWGYFTHDQARSRAYRWGEDGLMGFCDRECRLCFALALWNGKDPILKERLFGLTNPQGNHGEDVKEVYFYLDASPSYSYFKGLYKYPQAPFPYQNLIDENARRGRNESEYELTDTGAFKESRYFDVLAEYAKAGPDDMLIRITVTNRGPELATLDLLPTAWNRNSWSWGCAHEGCWIKPRMEEVSPGVVKLDHVSLGLFYLHADVGPDGKLPELLFTDNQTNGKAVFNDQEDPSRFTKDAFHRYLVQGQQDAVNHDKYGTKVSPHYRLDLAPGASAVVRLRLFAGGARPRRVFGPSFDQVFKDRVAETNAFYDAKLSAKLNPQERLVSRQALAGLLWSKQFYHYSVKDWLAGDPNFPPPPPERLQGRNADWTHLFNRDVILMPDKWEYPWYASWDLAFHTLAAAGIDPEFAKSQLILLLREWYMHPNGQIPAYEFAFSDVNPPVHAWACWRLYKMTGPRGKRDRVFLSRTFQKLLMNFTWWVNRKDISGRHLFSGGFLGLDNIGVFDRSRPLPAGGTLEQADGTAWMAFYCNTMLSIALELSSTNPATEDIASKFFEHFIAIADAMNTLGGSGLWDEQDGFYYDKLSVNGEVVPMRVRSVVGLMPLIAVEVLDPRTIRKLDGFQKRMRWFLNHRQDLARQISYMEKSGDGDPCYLLAIPSCQRLKRLLGYMLDENEFLSPFGIRSLSKYHLEHPYVMDLGGQQYRVQYEPGESRSDTFGGNSNWRGPIWLPLNYLIIEALERYHRYYGDDLKVECPTGSGKMMTLLQVSRELSSRLARLFLPDARGSRPCMGGDDRFAKDPAWRDLLLFHEYFDAETGRGCGASHQTGWTALAARLIEDRLRKW